MIDSYTATTVIVGFLVIFGVILPILDNIPKVKNFVSLRWTIVVVYSAMCLGVIIDFNHLDTSVRFAVVVGGIILSAIFLFVRSLEKAAANKWKYPRIKGSIKRGDTLAELSLSDKSQIGSLDTSLPSKVSKHTNEKEISDYILSQDQNSADFDEKMNQSIMLDQISKTSKKAQEN